MTCHFAAPKILDCINLLSLNKHNEQRSGQIGLFSVIIGVLHGILFCLSVNLQITMFALNCGRFD
jgi:hypothetical protein